MKPSVSCSSCPRLEGIVLIWSSSIWVPQVWLGPGMFVTVVVLVEVSVARITVGDEVALLWVVQTEVVFLRVGCAMICGNL